jgi:hypothetical protein
MSAATRSRLRPTLEGREIRVGGELRPARSGHVGHGLGAGVIRSGNLETRHCALAPIVV